MMVNSAHTGEGEGGGARSPSFTLSTITSKVVVHALAERADIFLLFLLQPILLSGVIWVRLVLLGDSSRHLLSYKT
jgi:hypothetical protein